MVAVPIPQQQKVFGHPAGLFTLFFAEMWERFSFYGMRALLVFYITKGFLGLGDEDSYTVYGAYASLVYTTPFFGGMLADRLLGQRRAVIFGGMLCVVGQVLLMLSGMLLESFGRDVCAFLFYGGLAFLIVGNGFFKPNISTIVGSLYEKHSTKRDAGFTIFYMGINLGAAISPLLCGYIGEKWGYHWGFSLAAAGMLIGLAVFAAPRIVTQMMIAGGSALAAVGLVLWSPDNPIVWAINLAMAVALLTAAGVAIFALSRGGMPHDAGRPSDPERLRRPVLGPITAEWAVYLGTFLVVPLVLALVSGFAPLSGKSFVIVPESVYKPLVESESVGQRIAGVVLRETSTPTGLILLLAFVGAYGYLASEAVRLDRVARQRLYVVFILTFFALLFFAFFEQAGISLNLFTDRNIDRVFNVSTEQVIGSEDVGKTISIEPTQEQLGYVNGDKLFTMQTLDELRKANKGDFHVEWHVVEQNVGMEIAHRSGEIAASTLQSANAIYILVFGLVISALWGFLATRRLEPSTPVKFAFGLMQLGLGFGAFWLGALNADSRGMVSIAWLLLGYLMHTTGELCLSPVGLSMVTRLSPQRLVATVMGAWFLATACSQFLASIISQFTSVDTALPPSETVMVYGHVFGLIAIASIISGIICLLIAPLLTRWMHEESQA